MPEPESGAKPTNVAGRTSGASLVRTVVLYLIVGAAAAGISGLYLFRYVPSKLQYFLGMRFRTLAVAAGQLKSKAESLSQALASAKRSVDADKQTPYLRILIPDVRRGTGTAAFVLDGDHHITWDDLVAQASAATQLNFDDLVLANEDGDVVWQREQTSPRIGNLARLLDSKSASDGWSLFSLQWNIQTTSFSVDDKKRLMPDTATSTLVNLDGRPSVLLTQPVELHVRAAAEKNRFFLGGLVSRAALQNEAMHVPTEWVVYALVPFALVFLSLPFIKLATVTSKERYSFGDMVALVLGTVLVAAIGGALPFLSDSPADQSDEKLKNFAIAIDRHFSLEVSHFLELAGNIQSGDVGPLARCKTAVTHLDSSVCDFWQAMPEVEPFAALDVVSWADPSGMQIQKWTAKSQITPPISLGDYQHFRDILSGRTWSLESGSGQFTVEPLRSPTTSEMAFVFAVPNRVTTPPQTKGPQVPTAETAPVIAVNVKPQALVDPLVPPGFGFAVLAIDGRVLFHSTSALSLEENFLRELSDVGPIAQAMSVGGEARWTGDYHGRRHRFYSTRVASLVNCPWRLVTFREIEPLLDFSAARQISALLLFVGYALVMLLVVAGYLLYHRISDRSVKDVVIATLIQTRDTKVTSNSILALICLGLVLVALVFSIDWVNPQNFTALYTVFLAAPLFAVIFVAAQRRSPAPAQLPADHRYEHFREATAVFLVALVLGALPAAGMARLAHRLDSIRQDLVWLTLSRDRSIERERTIQGFVKRTESYEQPTKDAILTKGFGMPRLDQTSRLLYSYQSQLLGIHLKDEEIINEPVASQNETRTRPKPTYHSYESAWIEKGLDWLRGSFAESRFTLPGVDISQDLTSIRLTEAAGDSTKSDAHYTADLQTGVLDDLRVGPAIAGVAILAATFFLIYWARHALSSHKAAEAMSIEDTIRQIQEGGPSPAILVIGPARNEKDRVAAEAIKQITNREPDLRIRLLDVIITADWVDDQIAAADRQKNPDESTEWLWIQVSNLETQLVDRSSRTEVFRLLEKLLERRVIDGVLQRPTGLIATTTIDPTAHFSEVFLEERQEIYANAVPEVELNRTSVVLSRFRRCYVPNEGVNPWDDWYDYDPSRWPDTLRAETSNHRLLSAVQVDLQHAWANRDDVAKDEMRRAIRVRAEPCYQLLWTSCTRSEKLVLIQLAQEGLINPKNSNTVDELVAKGLIWPGAAPMVFNLTFRDFLRGIERADVVQQWEHMEGSGSWVVSGRLVAIALVVGGLFYLVTQGISVQSVLPIISGSGFLGFPLARTIAGIFSPRKDNAAVS